MIRTDTKMPTKRLLVIISQGECFVKKLPEWNIAHKLDYYLSRETVSSTEG